VCFCFVSINTLLFSMLDTRSCKVHTATLQHDIFRRHFDSIIQHALNQTRLVDGSVNSITEQHFVRERNLHSLLLYRSLQISSALCTPQLLRPHPMLLALLCTPWRYCSLWMRTLLLRSHRFCSRTRGNVVLWLFPHLQVLKLSRIWPCLSTRSRSRWRVCKIEWITFREHYIIVQ
jgi:hypothetical protein